MNLRVLSASVVKNGFSDWAQELNLFNLKQGFEAGNNILITCEPTAELDEITIGFFIEYCWETINP